MLDLIKKAPAWPGLFCSLVSCSWLVVLMRHAYVAVFTLVIQLWGLTSLFILLRHAKAAGAWEDICFMRLALPEDHRQFGPKPA